MANLVSILSSAGIILVALICIFIIFARLYQRASKELSFVRTGFGGQKVIMNGGAFVIPVFHEPIPVNMNTLRLPVSRANQQALITRDRMRVDVLAEFYVRVKPEEGSIANAAQTLGHRTVQPEALKELIEGKFVDALRAVAAWTGPARNILTRPTPLMPRAPPSSPRPSRPAARNATTSNRTPRSPSRTRIWKRNARSWL